MSRWIRGGRSESLLRGLTATCLAITVLACASDDRARAQPTGLVDDTRYVFALDGMVVEWRGNWEYDPSSSGRDVGVEFASLISPLAGLLIGELAGGTPLDLDAFLALVLDSIAQDADEFVTVDRSATNTVSYSLDAAVIDGIPAGLFTYIQPNAVTGTIIFTSILAEATTFASSVEDAQANVTVNGRIALEGIDGAALQNLLPDIGTDPGDGDRDDDDRRSRDDDDGGEADDADRPTFDDADPDEEEAEDNRRSRLGGNVADDDDDVDGELAALGLVDDGLYESPQFGVEVEWSNDWELNLELLSSNEDNEVDNLGLNNDGGALVLVTIFEAGEATPEDFAAYWQSDDFLEENASDDVEILMADSSRGESAVLISDTFDDGDEFWALRQAYSLDGGDTIAIVLMLGVADDFPDNLEDAQDGISIDGDPALSLFSVDEVEDAA